MFPHESPRAAKYGRSPGNGISPVKLSREPLATEGEATPGPDDWNPYEDPPGAEPPEAQQLRDTHPFFQPEDDDPELEPEAEGADGDYQPEPTPLFRGANDPFRQGTDSEPFGFLEESNGPVPSLPFNRK